VIRTAGSPLRSRPNRWLAATSLAVVTAPVMQPFSPAAAPLGFVAPPLGFLAVLAALVGIYLVSVEAVKRRFYRRAIATGRAFAPRSVG
jgi:P-type Mg2+ transporter